MTATRQLASSGRYLDTPRGIAWQQRAACRTEDPELFFASGTTAQALLQVEAAKAVCRRCPVMKQCLQWAVDRNEQGVWGGQSEDDRKGRTSSRQEPVIRSGKQLAVEHGETLLRRLAGCDDFAQLAREMNATEEAVTYAVRLLAPDRLPIPASLTPLEDVLAQETSLRTLRRADLSWRKIGEVLRVSPTTVGAALTILSHRDAAQDTMELAVAA